MSSAPAPSPTVSCPFCSASNQADRRFCVGCGEEIKDECPKCRSEISSGDGFCSGCGYNVKDHYQQQIDEIESRMKEVEELIVKDHYDDAIAILSLLNRYKHPRIRETKAHVDKLYTLVKQKRDKRVQEVIALCDSAKLYATTGLISSAINEFERAPAHMLPPKAKAMLQDLRHKHSTIERLRNHIKQLVAKKQLLGLLPDIAKLSSLSNDEKEIEQLGIKLAARLTNEVKKLLSAAKFQQAYRVSNDLVDKYETEEVKKLKSIVRHRLALEHIVNRKYLADTCHLELVQKLEKTASNYPEIESLTVETKKLISSKAKDTRINLRARVKSDQTAMPGSTPWQLAAVSSLRFAKPEFELEAVQYLDCLGLGLQAIAEVPMDQSFAESKSHSLLSIFAAKKHKEAWGVVVEGTTLRAIRISVSADKSDPRPVVDQMLTIRHDEEQALEGRLRQNQQSLVTKFQARLKESPGEVAVGLSPKNVLPRFFTVPKVDQKKMTAAIEMELQHQSPFGKSEVIKRYEMFDDLNSQGAKPIMGTIVRKNDLESVVDVFTALGIKPCLVQTTPQATFNLVCREWYDQRHKFTEDNQGLLLVNVSDDVTTFFSLWQKRMWWRYVPLGRKDLISEVAKTARLTQEQAAKVVSHPALSAHMDLVLEACSEFYGKLIAELHRSQNQAEQFMMGIKSPHLIYSGVTLPFFLDALKFGADSLLPWSDSEYNGDGST